MYRDKKSGKQSNSRSSSTGPRDGTLQSKQRRRREHLDGSAKSYKKNVEKEKFSDEKLHETMRRHRSLDTANHRHQDVFGNPVQVYLTGKGTSGKKHEKGELSKSPVRNFAAKICNAEKLENSQKQDDFEEYSDDFEDSDDSAMIAQKQNIDICLVPASDLSNSPLVSRLLHSRDTSYRSLIDRKSSQTLIVTSTNANNTKNQYDALTNLLGMEIVRFEFADIPPINDYEFYMQMFGNDNRIQVQTQTHDDDNHRYVQTEDLEYESKWTQHPSIDELGWGIGFTKITESLNLNQVDTEVEYFRRRTVDNERLKNFLDIAAEVIIKLTSVPSDALFFPKMTYKSNLPYHLECNKFSLENIGAKAHVSAVLRHQNNLFIAYFINIAGSRELLGKTLVAQYDLKTPAVPQRLMMCENEINCACYASAKSDAIFAGLNDGSCVTFDLSEPLNHFSNYVEWRGTENLRLVVCTPAYDTAFRSISFEDEEDMRSSVIGINTTANTSSGSTSYQVASISEFGTIFVWAISEVEQQDSLVDLGLRPGAKLKMSLASIIRLSATCSSQSVSQSNLSVRCVTYDPNDPFHFFIGTDNKVIFNFTRDKGWSYTGPQTYKTQGLPVEIVCERFSPFDSKIFLAGLSNGHILFFKVERSQPILQLNHSDTNELPVTSIEFSPTTATKFYSICEKRYFFEWDLDRSKLPVLTCDLQQCFSSTVESTAIWLHHCSEQMNCVLLAFGLTNGELQLHTVESGRGINSSKNLAKTINRINISV